MKIVFFAILLALPQIAFGSESLSIDCKAIEGLSGNSTMITGTLQVTEQAQEYAAVEGILRVFIGGSTMGPVMDADVRVSGARLDDGSISLAAIEDESVAMIYINQTAKDVSFVERNGVQHISNCSGK